MGVRGEKFFNLLRKAFSNPRKSYYDLSRTKYVFFCLMLGFDTEDSELFGKCGRSPKIRNPEISLPVAYVIKKFFWECALFLDTSFSRIEAGRCRLSNKINDCPIPAMGCLHVFGINCS